MNVEKLENDLRSLVSNIDEEVFIYDLLLAYGQPKSAIARLQKGDYNLAKKSNEILWKKKLYYKIDTETDLHVLIDQVTGDPAITKHHPRFFIVTDFQTLLAVDNKTKDTLDIEVGYLPKHFDFFLPWAGMEKSQYKSENPADIKAAEKMARLYDMIMEDNDLHSPEERHALNIFLSRLLFCFFAEDTGIFEEDQFTNAIASHTDGDGSDLQTYLQRLFSVLNSRDRSSYPKFLQDFPYVNGGLFAVEYPVPRFTAKSRKIVIECGALNWKEINPDIFGSMIQAVVHRDQRSSMGMHYTSVVNIMKVIDPLFLNDLHEELELAGENEKKLKALLSRLYHLRIFDPACGSGNFLIIAFKELCKLEIKIFRRLHKGQLSFRFESQIRLAQFYGIELDDFAHETAKLSLWLAEHQMNMEFRDVFGSARPTLPLQDAGNVVCGNAASEDWEGVCQKEYGHEIYILGNPPYLGARQQNKKQKNDMKQVLSGIKGFNNLDYIACWFHKAAEYIQGSNAQFAFVSTNSICQGTQVELMWPSLLQNLEISFAHQSFKWTNNAKGNAGVTCVVVGIRNPSNDPKFIYNNGVSHRVSHINAYLSNADDIYIPNRREPISLLPPVNYGSFALDDGNFTISEEEKQNMVKASPEVEVFLRKFIGAKELIQGGSRYCVWIDDADLGRAREIDVLRSKIDRVKEWRSNSDREATKKLASVPHRFAEIRQPETAYLAFPTVSSERREYIPIAFVDSEAIASNQIYVVPDPAPYVFALISSRMHMCWVRAVAGQLETRIRYSASICYNTFPAPVISGANQAALEEAVFNVLDEREAYSERTLAELYDPDKMPEGLRNAHHEMDLAVDRCYRSRPFNSDEERLSHLFRLYVQMTGSRS